MASECRSFSCLAACSRCSSSAAAGSGACSSSDARGFSCRWRSRSQRSCRSTWRSRGLPNGRSARSLPSQRSSPATRLPYASGSPRRGPSLAATTSTAARRLPGPRSRAIRQSWPQCSMPVPTSMNGIAAATRRSMPSPSSAGMRSADCFSSGGRIRWLRTSSVGCRRHSWPCPPTSPPSPRRWSG